MHYAMQWFHITYIYIHTVCIDIYIYCGKYCIILFSHGFETCGMGTKAVRWWVMVIYFLQKWSGSFKSTCSIVFCVPGNKASPRSHVEIPMNLGQKMVRDQRQFALTPAGIRFISESSRLHLKLFKDVSPWLLGAGCPNHIIPYQGTREKDGFVTMRLGLMNSMIPTLARLGVNNISFTTRQKVTIMAG
jgi:hypothetical protein